ncbi:response regulator [Massilia sp. DWR3-1-1]|uniref:response regulator n=1 Tax=Massilia sp. DWR3-1-1 TaxID=2804559 RepID=UPI003CF566E4
MMSKDVKETPVIIADDDAMMRDLLASLLRQNGYHYIAFAQDGAQAAQLLGVAAYQEALVFLDIHMPGMDGLAALAAARAAGSKAFVVMVSADSALDKVLAALNGGASGFVIKPYTANRIIDMLDKFERGAQ